MWTRLAAKEVVKRKHLALVTVFWSQKDVMVN